MNAKTNILLAYYGDDFTGSTDALEFITRAGAKTVLFTETPTTEQLSSVPGLQAFGIAGKTRALNPEEMEQQLRSAFERMKESGAAQLHYKVCSTFDSSPTVGSIGKAIDCGSAVFHAEQIPVLGGMPSLGRYCVFGNLYAQMGTGTNGKVYRIDRHPSMSKHPVTPADESDLRLHLGRQTKKSFGLIDCMQLDTPVQEWALQKNEEVILLDALTEQHLFNIGEWLLYQQQLKGHLFSVGSSGIEKALGHAWQKTGILHERTNWVQPEKANPLLVLSGSCSPVTAAQIEKAKANGFSELILGLNEILPEGNLQESFLENVKKNLSGGKHLIIHTGSKAAENFPAALLGTVLGNIARFAVKESGLRRIVVAGGDTSSYAARAMGIDAVEMIAPLVTGAPLCRALSAVKYINGLEVNFKGGQVGEEDYFLKAIGS